MANVKIIMITYIFLNKEDKQKLSKLAQSKQLSLSACVDIIVTNYYYAIGKKENYYNKGTEQICLKIRNTIKQNLTCIIVTNSVYAYLHNDILKDFPNKDFCKKANKKIQSEMDKRYDPNFLKNLMIRQSYAQLKALKEQA